MGIYDEERTMSDAGPPSEVRRLERLLDVMRDRVAQQDARIAVLESSVEGLKQEQKDQKDQTSKTRTGPSRSEFLAAATGGSKKEEGGALEALKTVGPWILAALAIISTLVNALLHAP